MRKIFKNTCDTTIPWNDAEMYRVNDALFMYEKNGHTTIDEIITSGGYRIPVVDLKGVTVIKPTKVRARK